MAEPRLRRAGSPGELENVVDDYVTQGYEILDRGENTVMVRKKSWGTGVMHGVVFLLTIWWTAGLGNVAYALYAHLTAEKVLVKYTPPVAEQPAAPPPAAEQPAPPADDTPASSEEGE